MIEWIEAPDDVIAVRYIGKNAKADVEESFRVCRQRLERHKTIGAVVDLSRWEGFSAEALLEDVKEALDSLKWAGRVRAKAVVTDSQGWRVYTALAASLVHHPRLRSFPSGAMAEAVRWAAAPAESDAA